MKINIARVAALLISLLLLGATTAPAKHSKKRTTPYGDYCSRVSQYGMHKHMLTNKQIDGALKHYFGEKGLDYEIINREGRFIKAIIKDKGKEVDTIIFDRHTGRIKSVY